MNKRAIKTAKLEFWLRSMSNIQKYLVVRCSGHFSILKYFFQFFRPFFAKLLHFFSTNFSKVPFYTKRFKNDNGDLVLKRQKKIGFFAVNSKFSKRHTHFHYTKRWAVKFCIVLCTMRKGFGFDDGIKKYFLLLSIMAENKRIGKIFFSKCVAASRLKSSRMRWRFELLSFWRRFSWLKSR